MTTNHQILPNPSRDQGPRVAVLAYDGLCTFEFGVAYEVFGLPRPEMGRDWYRYTVCAVEPGPLRAAGGLTVTVDTGLEALNEADLIIVPGWRDIAAPVPPALIERLVDAHRRGARLMSLCSGVAVLAATGLLNGRRATSHWRYVAALAATYPAIRFEAAGLYVDEGDILTAAGSAAGIDLALHVVRGDFGPDAANSVARRLVVPPHRAGGQAQFIPAPVARDHEASRLGAVIDHMRANLAEPLPIAALAQRAGMSERTFHRRFQALTGESPGEWLTVARVARACELMEREPTAPLDEIAVRVGLGGAGNMRQVFRARLGITPNAYRASFSGIAGRRAGRYGVTKSYEEMPECPPPVRSSSV